MKAILIIAVLSILMIGTIQAYADPVAFSKCAANPDHHCYEYIPAENVGPQVNPNWHVTIVFPQTGAPTYDGVFTNDNFTYWKNNVAVMWVGNIFTTSASPTLNFCPLAKVSLMNQGVPQYLAKFYNTTSGLDLTNYVYPKWCHIESGSNPINGDNSIPAVPEFGNITYMVIIAAITSMVIISRMRQIK